MIPVIPTSRKFAIALATLALVACSNGNSESQIQDIGKPSTSIETTSPEGTSTNTPEPTKTAVPTRTLTSTPEGPYPAPILQFYYDNNSENYKRFLIQDGDQNFYAGGFCDPDECTAGQRDHIGGYSVRHGDCELPDCSFQVDIMIVEPEGPVGDFFLGLDLHGLGTVRSWYAQIGSHLSQGKRLSLFCNVFSYNSDTARYWRAPSGQVLFDHWYTFKIEVQELDNGWGYGFALYLDGQIVCEYAPPEDWDGDERYDVIHQVLFVSFPGETGRYQGPEIEIRLANFYTFYTPEAE